jgi:hypothetical protein
MNLTRSQDLAPPSALKQAALRQSLPHQAFTGEP